MNRLNNVVALILLLVSTLIRKSQNQDLRLLEKINTLIDRGPDSKRKASIDSILETYG